MGHQIVAKMLPVLEKLEWRGGEEATRAGRVVFMTAIDQIDSFRGDPQVLGAALRTLRTSDSLPYAYGGVAYLLVIASAEENGGGAVGDHDPAGLEAALSWLERAQALAPDVTDLNVIEPLIYIFSGRYDDARLVLDYLHDQSPHNYFLHRAEMYYWQYVGELDEALSWNEQAMSQAETVPQRLRLKSMAATLHLQRGDTDQALQAYQEALHFDDDNAWLCHQISRLHYDRGELEEAARFNQQALKFQPDFTPALRLRQAMADEGHSAGLLGRLFG